MTKKIAIIGTGAYGTCLANVLADNGHQVEMFGIVKKEIEDINKGINTSYFSNIVLNSTIKADNDFKKVVNNSQYIILAVPVKVVSEICHQLNKVLTSPVVIINTAKGLNHENGEILSQLITKKIKPQLLTAYVGIYGPSIAKEVISRKQTCIMAVSKDKPRAQEVAALFNNNYFHVLVDTDIVAAEYAVALKNAIAIASGIFYTLSESDNANASFLTMGLNEIKNIAVTNGAKETSFFNYACLADLILTASSLKSRNFSFGHDLVINKKNIIIANVNKTIEGVLTCQTIYNVIQVQNLKAPILTILYEILFLNQPVEKINTIFNSL